jgi:hypothetical protein
MYALAGNDAAFGPQYRGPGGPRLDITLKFLELILVILPTAFFILLAALLVVVYKRRPVYVRPSPLLWTKQVRHAGVVTTKQALYLHTYLADCGAFVT